MNQTEDIFKLLDKISKSQWNFQPNFDLVKDFKIMTRQDLQNLKMEKGFFNCKSSGSTGEPVKVEKTYSDYIWYFVSNMRELIWKKWDVSKNMAAIKPNVNIGDKNSWGMPTNIIKGQGKIFFMNYQPISVIQKWLEEKNPHYIHC